MDHGNNESAELWLYNKVSKKMCIPNKSFISPFKQRQLIELWLCLEEVMLSLKRVGQVICIGVVKSRCCKHSLDHREICLIIPILQ